MTIFSKTLVAAAATVLTMTGSAWADAHAELDVAEARLDVSLDTNGDGEVSNDEIIEGNMATFDLNGDGMIDAAERGEADVFFEAAL